MVYPQLDQVPDPKDPMVQKWMTQYDLSGVPDLPRSNGGVINHDQPSCDNKTKIDPNQGSWTCQKYVETDDIKTCPTIGNWGVTYDDGPSSATPMLLDALDECNLKATFFVVGSRVISHPEILLNAYKKGHHIAVHTWSHPALSSLSTEEIVAELGWTMKAIKDVIGVTPIYYRPPYGDTDNRIRAITRAMRLITVLWLPDFDSNDWTLLSTPPQPISYVISTFDGWMKKFPTMSTGFIVLEHDLYNATVKAAVEVIKLAVKVQGLNMTTVAQCVGDSKPYVELGGKPSNVVNVVNSTNSTTTKPANTTATLPASAAAATSAASTPSGKPIPSSAPSKSNNAETTPSTSSGNSLVITILPMISILLTSLFALK
ncbi:Carbohydrate Esterase Family 4 protein [Gigaspora rosea]|uniref:chitin deacetylase n=1 Tax=Gigaspora rosea TaxID=44941 RepID=A0A397VXM0_9GLOM|nr:Carbohydrate Esterase Family 4 protein [Gigaspora rosea]